MRPRVVVVLVNWNGVTDTLECLASLYADGYPCLSVVVVDNGSVDDSVPSIRAAYPDAIVLEAGRNLGFTGGNNVGILYALDHGADYVYLLNNDTTIEAGSLEKLAAAAEGHARAGIVAPIMHYADRPGEVWFGGSSLDIGRGLALHDHSDVPAVLEPPREIPWVTGCAMLVRAEALRALGGFDERYYLYFEDVDLSVRVRKLGCTIVLVPSARIYHKCGQTGNKTKFVTDYYGTRNQLLFVATHSPSTLRRFVLTALWERQRLMRFWLKEDAARVLPLMKYNFLGFYDFFRKRFGAYPYGKQPLDVPAK